MTAQPSGAPAPRHERATGATGLGVVVADVGSGSDVGSGASGVTAGAGEGAR